MDAADITQNFASQPALARTKFTRRGAAVASAFVAAAIAAAAGGQALAPIFVLGALVACLDSGRLKKLSVAIKKGGVPLFFFALFWAWLGVTAFWSPQTNPKTLIAVLIYLPTLLLFTWSANGDNEADRAMIVRAGIACVFVLALLVAQEGVFRFPFYTAERGPIDKPGELTSARHTLAGAGSALAVLLWPAIAALDRKGGRAYLVLLIPIALTVAVARYSHASSILLALMVGGVCYLAARAYPRVMIIVAGLTIVEILLAAPRIASALKYIPPSVQELLPGSYRHRMEIWQNAATLIEQKPWFGWGLDAAKTFTQAHNYISIGQARLIPWHPHNAPLHLWLETGLVGAGLASALVLALTLSLVRGLSHDNKATAGAVGAIGAFCVFAGVSFGIWQAWFLSAGFAAAGLVTALVKKREGGRDAG
jgi:O-antigen ligase